MSRVQLLLHPTLLRWFQLVFELGDILDLGSHQLMVGHDDEKMLAKLIKFLQKEFPTLDILKNENPIFRAAGIDEKNTKTS